jgi:hypothetical protein
MRVSVWCSSKAGGGGGSRVQILSGYVAPWLWATNDMTCRWGLSFFLLFTLNFFWITHPRFGVSHPLDHGKSLPRAPWVGSRQRAICWQDFAASPSRERFGLWRVDRAHDILSVPRSVRFPWNNIRTFFERRNAKESDELQRPVEKPAWGLEPPPLQKKSFQPWVKRMKKGRKKKKVRGGRRRKWAPPYS